MSELYNIALRNEATGQIKSWHRELAKHIPAIAVYNIFMGADYRNDTMLFHSSKKLQAAQHFTSDIEKIFPNTRLATAKGVVRFTC